MVLVARLKQRESTEIQEFIVGRSRPSEANQNICREADDKVISHHHGNLGQGLQDDNSFLMKAGQPSVYRGRNSRP